MLHLWQRVAPAGKLEVSASAGAGVAAEAAPTTAGTAPTAVASAQHIAAEAAPTTAGARPLDRAAVLAAIARGKARRAKDTHGS